MATEVATRVKGQHESGALGTAFSEGAPQEVLTLSALLKFPQWGEVDCVFIYIKVFFSPSSCQAAPNPNRNTSTAFRGPFLHPKIALFIFPLTTAQGSVDEEPDDYWRRPQVQADLRSGYLLPGDPSTREL